MNEEYQELCSALRIISSVIYDYDFTEWSIGDAALIISQLRNMYSSLIPHEKTIAKLRQALVQEPNNSDVFKTHEYLQKVMRDFFVVFLWCLKKFLNIDYATYMKIVFHDEVRSLIIQACRYGFEELFLSQFSKLSVGLVIQLKKDFSEYSEKVDSALNFLMQEMNKALMLKATLADTIKALGIIYVQLEGRSDIARSMEILDDYFLMHPPLSCDVTVNGVAPPRNRYFFIRAKEALSRFSFNKRVDFWREHGCKHPWLIYFVPEKLIPEMIQQPCDEIFAHLLVRMKARFLEIPKDEKLSPLVGRLSSIHKEMIGTLKKDIKRLEKLFDGMSEKQLIFGKFLLNALEALLTKMVTLFSAETKKTLAGYSTEKLTCFSDDKYQWLTPLIRERKQQVAAANRDVLQKDIECLRNMLMHMSQEQLVFAGPLLSRLQELLKEIFTLFPAEARQATTSSPTLPFLAGLTVLDRPATQIETESPLGSVTSSQNGVREESSQTMLNASCTQALRR